MAKTMTRRADHQYETGVQPSWMRIGSIFRLRRTVLLTFLFSALTFIAALYYVEQQLQLRALNYDIIELKQQKKQLIEQHKTAQLQLDQLKRLDQIEEEMKRRGFAPVAEAQIRMVQ